jgi:hypothetical protein
MATIYAATADGYVYHTGNNWNNVHDATTKDPKIEYTSGGYANDPLGQDMDNKESKVIGVSSSDIRKVSGA